MPTTRAAQERDAADPVMTQGEVSDSDPGEVGVEYAVVVPTIGRASLRALLASLDAQTDLVPTELVIVDDRPRSSAGPLQWHPSSRTGSRAPEASRSYPHRVVRSFGRGPAAARNLGWRVTSAPWVVFLDDDVLLPASWSRELREDLEAAARDCGGIQARLHVPAPVGRRPTDVERGTLGLVDAVWATADMAYRRAALAATFGFDERFPRAYREDADLAVRVRQQGWALKRGLRTTTHPLREPSSADRSASIRSQRGNADDALMRRLHGPGWREAAQAPRGRLRWHACVSLTGVLALAAAATGHRRVAGAAGAAWLAATADFAVRRIAPGPRTAAEITSMLTTSAAIPPLALAQRLRGAARHRHATPWPPPLEAVLFDRDGTLVVDVPYNGDPDLVEPVKDAAEVVARLTAAGVRTGVVTNQSGIARGLLTREDVEAVNAAIDARIGPFDDWQVCPHGPDQGCACRKPAPGMVLAACAALGVSPVATVLIGDIGPDVDAARAAGARGILVPTPGTRAQEVRDAPWVASSLTEAVEAALHPLRPRPGKGLMAATQGERS